ncbi:MAG TPA: hypothetical protein VLH09_07050, partial [Bryobacteraceae bacterium]|nr:hypothetical protein [Bryobacteraceae bacterium]
PEVMSGMPVYVGEELGAKVDEDGNVIHEETAQQRTAAAAAVAERKITGMKAGKSYAEVSGDAPAEAPAPATEPPPEEAAGQIKARLEQFAKMRATVGDEAYYRILGSHGAEHANDVKSLNKAREIFRELQAEHKAQLAAQAPPAEEEPWRPI